MHIGAILKTLVDREEMSFIECFITEGCDQYEIVQNNIHVHVFII
jgi:hypothetical protein